MNSIKIAQDKIQDLLIWDKETFTFEEMQILKKAENILYWKITKYEV